VASGIPITEDEFRERTVSNYLEHFNHVYRLHEFAQAAMGTFKGEQKTAYHVCLVLILPKAFKSFDAIRRLCEVASCEDAAVILRSLLNLMAVTRWLSIEPQKRGRKYLAWYWIARQADAKNSKDRIPPEWIPMIQSHYDRVKGQFEYRDPKGKTRMPTHWYQPEVHTLRAMFAEVGLEKHYEEAYKPLSGIEHSDATSYLPMLLNAERKEGERRLEIQSDLNIPHYLRNAFQYFADIFRLCNKTNHVADDSQLEQIISDGTTFYKADMQSKGISPF
jgi:hypothetical protein